MPPDRTVVVMGVAGSGKTTVGQALAQRLGVDYGEADAFHPAANVAKMAAGIPLDDADRAPWLAAIANWIGVHVRAGQGCVVTCSGLAVRYRDVLRGADPGLLLVHLVASPELILARVSGRPGHFMPAGLVGSQFDVLEPLLPREHGLVVDAARPVEEILDQVVQRLAPPAGDGERAGVV